MATTEERLLTYLVNSKNGEQLPVLVNVQGSEFFIIYNPNTERFEKVLLSTAISTEAIIQGLGYTPEDVDNKAIDFSVINNDLYPSTKAVDDFITDLKSTPNGLAGTDGDGKIPASLLPTPPITLTIAGQSNALGKHSGGDMTSDSRVLVWRKDLGTPDWVIADLTLPPFNGNNNLGFQFAKKYAETYDVEVKMIVNADDWQSIARWTGTGVPDTMYTDLTDQIMASGTTNVDIFLWHQGEANYSSTTVTEYAAEMKLLLAKLKTEEWYSEDTPFIAGELLNIYPQMNEFYQNPRFSDWIVDKNFTVAQAADLTGEAVDGVPFLHFSGEELVLLGRERYWDAWKSISEQYNPVNKSLYKRLSGRMSVGENSSTINLPSYDPSLYINGDSIVPLLIEREGTLFSILQAYANTAFSPHYESRKARGTKSAPLPVLANDNILDLTGYGHDGNNFVKGASIELKAATEFNATDRGSDIVFKTVKNGTTSLLERLRIHANGITTSTATNADIDAAGNDVLITKEWVEANALEIINNRILDSSTTQTSTLLNNDFPLVDNPVGTTVINLNTLQPFMYIRITNLLWRAVSLGNLI